MDEGPRYRGHFLTCGTFNSPQDVGHLRILEQGQSQIPTLARGVVQGLPIDSCINPLRAKVH